MLIYILNDILLKLKKKCGKFFCWFACSLYFTRHCRIILWASNAALVFYTAKQLFKRCLFDTT